MATAAQRARSQADLAATRTAIKRQYPPDHHLDRPPPAPACRTARAITLVSTSLVVLGMLGTLPALAAGADTDEQPQDAPPAPAPEDSEGHGSGGVFSDVKAYVTSPLRWNGTDWLYFGGALAAVGLAHHFDANVRKQYAPAAGSSSTNNTYDLQDIAPTAALFVGTWGLALLSDDAAGHKEGWAMLEAATFSAAASYTLKFAAGRERPSQTDDPNLWRHGGASFPSLHSTVAFAVGTVMAESGNDDYRWLRRVLGYGVGVLTSYERVKHNQHWLSDTVAGAALGAATARFAMNRRYGTDGSATGLSVAPTSGGLMLTYNREW